MTILPYLTNNFSDLPLVGLEQRLVILLFHSGNLKSKFLIVVHTYPFLY